MHIYSHPEIKSKTHTASGRETIPERKINIKYGERRMIISRFPTEYIQ